MPLPSHIQATFLYNYNIGHPCGHTLRYGANHPPSSVQSIFCILCVTDFCTFDTIVSFNFNTIVSGMF